MNAIPLATMTVNVIPNLPDDFPEVVDRAVRIATADALIRQGIGMLSGYPELDKQVHEALHALWTATHPDQEQMGSQP